MRRGDIKVTATDDQQHYGDVSDTCRSCCGLKQKKGRWRSRSMAGWSLSSRDGNTMFRGGRVNNCRGHPCFSEN